MRWVKKEEGNVEDTAGKVECKKREDMNFYEKGIADGVFRPLKEEPVNLIIDEIELDDAIYYKVQDYCKNNSLTKSEQLLVYNVGDYLMEVLFSKLKDLKG